MISWTEHPSIHSHDIDAKKMKGMKVIFATLIHFRVSIRLSHFILAGLYSSLSHSCGSFISRLLLFCRTKVLPFLTGSATLFLIWCPPLESVWKSYTIQSHSHHREHCLQKKNRKKKNEFLNQKTNIMIILKISPHEIKTLL